MLWIAFTAAFAGLLAHHLGLTEAVAAIVSEAAKCTKCTVFWVTLAVLLYSGCDAVAAVALSLCMSYLSYWAGFALVGLQKLYDRLWKRLNGNK